jgi:cystathionine beta-lyase/cystathionine gamma-synthase
MERDRNRETQFTAVAHDPVDKRHHGSISIPIYQTSLFAFDTHDNFDNAMLSVLDHHVYSRGNNPTVLYLEEKLAELEAGESAKCFASGMAAITSSILSIVKNGDHIICPDQVYGPTREFLGLYLERFGIETSFIDGSSLEQWQAAIRPNTKLFYLESPTSAFFELQDLRELSVLAHRNGAITLCDGSWATPINQQPLNFGVDLVVHSITKYLAGHSDCLGGVIIGAKPLIERISKNEYMLFGGIMTPQSAALVIRGLRTLPLRMQRHQESGLIIANYLLNQSYVTKVNHPGLSSHPQHKLALQQMTGYSSLFSFESAEPANHLRAWADKLKYFKIGVSWGGFESLVTVKAFGEGSIEGIRTLVRLYVGMESPEDLIRDMDEAWHA